MSDVFTSDTPQPSGTQSWTFVNLHVDANGDCWTAENRAGRDLKPKGLVVRYANPFTASAKVSLPEVVYVLPDPIAYYLRTATGEHHVFSKAKHHCQDTNGKWTKVEVITERVQRFVNARDFGDRMIIALGWPEAFLEWSGAAYRPIEVGTRKLTDSISGTGPDDIYISTGHGMHHFDGEKWSTLPSAPRHGHVHSVSKDMVYATGTLESGSCFFYRGNAREGFTGLVPREDRTRPNLKSLTFALGELYATQSGDHERGLYRYDAERNDVVQVMQATSYNGRLAGNDKVLWVENGIELLCTDGKSWKSVPRVHHDKSKA